MGFFAWTRWHGARLAMACALMCLPSLVLAGVGRCPLLVSRRAGPVAQVAPSPGCCGACGAHSAGAKPVADIALPEPAGSGAASCNACPSPEWIVPDLKRLEAPGVFHGAVATFSTADFVSEDAPALAVCLPRRSGPAPPAGVFLRVVTRRCFPSLAPPSSLAFVS